MKNTVRMFLTQDNVLWRMSEMGDDNMKAYVFTWANEIVGLGETEVFSTTSPDVADAFWWGVVMNRYTKD